MGLTAWDGLQLCVAFTTSGCICNRRLHLQLPVVLQLSAALQLLVALQLPVALQLSVALPYVHQGARRVLGATAKPLYVIDRKTEGFVGRVTL